MKFDIVRVILWPKNKKNKLRTIDFVGGKLNVISGRSRTGKSALIPIIDYCLGSDSCLIPVSLIRNQCEWFGVLVETTEGQKLLCRREPAGQQSTSECFVIEDATVKIPDSIDQKNATTDYVKSILNRLAGLTSLTFALDEANVGFRSRPSFRDLVAFNFQPQNVIANADVLFYKAHTYEHREKLQTIFPYVLGALDAADLAKRHELTQLLKDLRKKERELANAKTVSQNWIAEVDGKLQQAVEYGLIDGFDSAAALDAKLAIVRSIVQKSNAEVRSSLARIHDSVRQLDEIQVAESRLSGELMSAKRRYSEAVRMQRSSQKYASALSIQRDRLGIASFLRVQATQDPHCVLCGAHNAAVPDLTAKLLNEMSRLEETIAEVKDSPALLSDEIYRLRRRIRELTQDLDAVQTQRQQLQRTSQSAQRDHYSSLSVSRFIGSMEQSLALYERLGTDSSLASEVEKLNAAVEALRKDIDEGRIKTREVNALTRISNYAGRLLPLLDCERPNDPVELSIADLNVRVRGKDRSDSLSEIGSGSNWLSYHIAILLAMHKLFLEQATSPVASFLMLDQPSQVYFPTGTTAAAEAKTQLDYDFTDEDIAAVRKTYKVLSDMIAETKGQLQIIVVDHAGTDVWGGLPHLHFVEEWRQGNALIQPDWNS